MEWFHHDVSWLIGTYVVSNVLYRITHLSTGITHYFWWQTPEVELLGQKVCLTSKAVEWRSQTHGPQWGVLAAVTAHGWSEGPTVPHFLCKPRHHRVSRSGGSRAAPLTSAPCSPRQSPHRTMSHWSPRVSSSLFGRPQLGTFDGVIFDKESLSLTFFW